MCLADLDAAELQTPPLADRRFSFQIILPRFIHLDREPPGIFFEHQLQRIEDFLERCFAGHYGLTEAAPKMCRVTRSCTNRTSLRFARIQSGRKLSCAIAEYSPGRLGSRGPTLVMLRTPAE